MTAILPFPLPFPQECEASRKQVLAGDVAVLDSGAFVPDHEQRRRQRALLTREEG